LDEWSDENSEIGKAYGYQMNKPIKIYADIVHKTPESYREYENQADFIINYLKEFPNGRWGVATLWNPTELSEMGLVPCCHTSTWNLDGGRLNCVLDQRSGDMPYGVPFNTTQYAELMIMIAKALSTPEKEVKPGILTHVIADAHIYDNQMKGVCLQLQYYEIMDALINYEDDKAYEIAEDVIKLFPESYSTVNELIIKAKKALESVPHFEIYADNPYDFFSYTADNCKVEDYVNMGKIDFGDVAV
jgi:thymidylate synthase